MLCIFMIESEWRLKEENAEEWLNMFLLSLKKIDLFLFAGQLVQKTVANMRKEIISPEAFLHV